MGHRLAVLDRETAAFLISTLTNADPQSTILAGHIQAHELETTYFASLHLNIIKKAAFYSIISYINALCSVFIIESAQGADIKDIHNLDPKTQFYAQ